MTHLRNLMLEELERRNYSQNIVRTYLMTIEDRRRVIASGTFILREEGPHYSGKVEFSDSETKAK